MLNGYSSVRYALVALCALSCLSCTESVDVSQGGPIAQAAEFPFDQELGAKRALAWSVSPFNDRCWALSNDNGYFVARGNDVEKHTSGPVTTPPTWRASVPFEPYAFEGGCPTISPSTDGGVVVGGRVLPMRGTDWFNFGIARIAADGAVQWKQKIAGVESGSYAGQVAMVALNDGGAALSYTTHPADGSIAEVARVIVLLGSDGNERARAIVPPDGGGSPLVVALAATRDGGVIGTGGYEFPAARDYNRNGLLARVDAQGKLVWAKRYGDGFNTTQVRYEVVAESTDGAFLAAGWVFGANTINNPPVQAIATRFDGDGKKTWSNAYPFGKLPGIIFTKGQTKFDAIATREGGAFDVVMHPPGAACRIVRFEPNGTISRVQILVTGECDARAFGPDLAYTSGALNKMAP